MRIVLFLFSLLITVNAFSQTISDDKKGTIKVSKSKKDQSTLFSFSPNADGKNDYFMLSLHNINKINVRIYTQKKEELIYEWNDINGKWDGKNLTNTDAKAGLYYFIANTLDAVGNRTIYENYVTLIR